MELSPAVTTKDVDIHLSHKDPPDKPLAVFVLINKRVVPSNYYTCQGGGGGLSVSVGPAISPIAYNFVTAVQIAAMERVALKQRVHEHLTETSLPPWPTISFRHPAYANPNDILFKLPRLDHTEQASTLDRGPAEAQAEPALGPEHEPVTGVHHGTALLACQIIANNAFDGYLATDRRGQDPVVLAPDGVLTRETYWFIVDRQGDGIADQVGVGDTYPVVPRFEEWEFPHDGFPALGWDAPPVGHVERTVSAGPPTTFAVPALPSPVYKRCILSNNTYATHMAHLVPSAQADWYQGNSMIQYEDDQEQPRFMNTRRNKVYMRHDLHTVWDSLIFALVPKRGDFVVHVLATPTPGIREFTAEWHNVPVQRGALQGVGKAYMLAKFAQAVFMLAKPFIAYSADSRYVARRQAQAVAGGPREAHETRMQWLSGSSLRRLYSGGGLTKSTSASSGSKRSRSQVTGDDELDEEGGRYERNVSVWASDSDDELKREGEWRKVCAWASDSDDELKREGEWRKVCAWASDSDDELKREGEWRKVCAWASDSDDELERGRPRKRRRRRDRSEHTLDTLPSLTDTSAIGGENPGLSFSSQVDSGLLTASTEPQHDPQHPADSKSLRHEIKSVLGCNERVIKERGMPEPWGPSEFQH